MPRCSGTYRDCKKEANLFVKEFPSPRTICRRIHSLPLDEEEVRSKADLIQADGTKAHGLGRDNDVNVVIGIGENNDKKLLACRVNVKWEEMRSEIEDKVNNPYLIADGERGIPSLIEKEDNFQLCLNHTVRYVNYLLWRDMADKETRKEITDRLKSTLFTLKNSVLKNMDKDRERIRSRVDWAVDEMKKLHDRAKEISLTAARFIRRASNRAVTFARVCYEKGKLIPWNNNLIERLMGELSKRIKHKWMHWSTRGLEAIANLILIGYTDEERYHKLRDMMLNSDRNGYISCSVISLRPIRREF